MLQVETGAGLPDALSYASVEEATTYHTAFGNTVWAEQPDKQESCLARATQTVDIVWGQKFLSRKATKQQALLFPRLGFYDNNGDYITNTEIPKCLKDAVIELALETMTAGTDLITVDTTTGIKKTVQKVGDLEESIEYFSAGNEVKATQEKYSKADMLLSRIVGQPNFGITL